MVGTFSVLFSLFSPAFLSLFRFIDHPLLAPIAPHVSYVARISSLGGVVLIRAWGSFAWLQTCGQWFGWGTEDLRHGIGLG